MASPATMDVSNVGAELVENRPLASPLIMSVHVGAELVENSSTWSPVNIPKSDVSVTMVVLRSAVIFEVPFHLFPSLNRDAQLQIVNRCELDFRMSFGFIHTSFVR